MYLIDGYNLMHFHDLEKLEFIEKIKKFVSEKKKKALLIFDGVQGFGENLFFERLEIRYSLSADDEIIYILQKNKNPNALVLISSDNELINYAKEKKVKFTRSENFNFDIKEEISDEENKSCELTEKEAREMLKEFNEFKKT